MRRKLSIRNALSIAMQCDLIRDSELLKLAIEKLENLHRYTSEVADLKQELNKRGVAV